MAYATLEDYEARYGELGSETARSRVSVRLDDAAVYLDARVEVDPDDEHQAAALKIVSCAMVNRAMAAEESDAVGVSEARYTMGPFTQSATFSNPSGDLYLTAGEKALLGVNGSLITGIRPVVGWAGC